MKDLGLSELVEPFESGDVPGVVIGVYTGGELAASAVGGQGVIEHAVPLGQQTVFDIASASKHMTAACLLLLQSDGAFSIDDDVRRHLPELSFRLPVSIRQCLSHTGGLREYYSLCELAGIPLAGMDEDRLTELLVGQADLDFAPGSSWSYSNSGYALATAIVRRLSGRSLAEFAGERLFGPLGMAITRFRDDLTVPVRHLATGYTSPREGGGWRRVDICESTVGDGGVITSLDDLCGWYEFMSSGAGLGIDVRDGLLAPALLADGRRLPYALGLKVLQLGPHRAYLHSGSIEGFRSALGYLPEAGTGVAVLANRDDAVPAEIALQILARLSGSDLPEQPGLLGSSAALARRPSVLGRWFTADLEQYIDVDASEGGTVAVSEHGSVDRYAARSDGTWSGLGSAAGTCFRQSGDTLRRQATVADPSEELFVRGREAPVPESPAGTYYSDELSAFATLDPFEGVEGASTLAVGLAERRLVVPVAAGVWAGGGVTANLSADGATLSISLEGARHCRFTQVVGSAPPRQRGL